MLHRIAQRPAAGDSSYSDVSSQSYYSAATAWAEKSNLVSGYPDGSFSPDSPITRQDLALVLYQMAQYQQLDTAVSSAVSLEDFSDAAQISPYARQAMAWTWSHGIMSGTDQALLAPQAQATRGQVAVMLAQYLQLLNSYSK